MTPRTKKLKLGRETVRLLSGPAPSPFFGNSLELGCTATNCASGNRQCFQTSTAYCTN